MRLVNKKALPGRIEQHHLELGNLDSFKKRKRNPVTRLKSDSKAKAMKITDRKASNLYIGVKPLGPFRG